MKAHHGGPVSDSRRILPAVLGWVALISGIHMSLNVDWSGLWNDQLPEAQRKLHVAYIPVT
ncbi:MAG: hypothetical protein EXR72_13035 [Myxococcales bacterium]|nr:hypothetical protein [Myxococcales bacterium]